MTNKLEQLVDVFFTKHFNKTIQTACNYKDLLVTYTGSSKDSLPREGVDLSKYKRKDGTPVYPYGAEAELVGISAKVPLGCKTRIAQNTYGLLKKIGLTRVWPTEIIENDIISSQDDKCVEKIEKQACNGNIRILSARYRIKLLTNTP